MHEAAFSLVLAVIMHVSWNLMARQQPRAASPLWWVMLGCLAWLLPWGGYALLFQIQWDADLIMLLALSATANSLYFLFLQEAYNHGPVALVYPLSRSAPLPIALWSLFFHNEQLSWHSWLGIVVSVIGLWLMASSADNRNDRRALVWAFLAMAATSVYSLCDKAAIARLNSFGEVLGFALLIYLSCWLALSWRLRQQSGKWIPQQRIKLSMVLIGGICIAFGYALIIQAMRYLPAAEVISYSNAGIVLASLISLVYFRERHNWPRRISGMLLICLGLATMAWASL